MKILLLIISLLLACPCNGSAIDQQLLKQDTSLVSPDGKFTVTFGFRSQDGEMVLSVLNNKTGQVYKSVPAGPCYFLKWAPDSRTMVAIYPMSRGDSAAVIHFDGTSWQQCCAGCRYTDNFLHTSTIKIGFNKNTISFVQASSDRISNADNIIAYYLISFDIDPSTTETSNYSKTNLDRPRYLKLLRTAQL